MPEDYKCPVCGKHFAEEEDYKDHKEQDHPEVEESYPQAFEQNNESPYIPDDDKEEADEEGNDLIWNNKTNHYEKPADEDIEPEEWNKADVPERKEILDKENDFVPREDLDEPYEELEPETKEEIGEDGGADDPLKKVADLAENYRFMQKDDRAKIFESIGITQEDASKLSGLEWNELSKPLKKDASEAYVKSQEQEEEEEEEDEEEKEVNESYSNFYNLENNHRSPDYRKKVVCENCNLIFENKSQLDTHYNDVHVPYNAYEVYLDEEDKEDALSY